MTLTQIALLTKQSLAAAVILMFLSVTGWLGWQYYLSIQPPPPPVLEIAEAKFGKLPQLLTPESTISASNYTYSIDTETGKLPEDLPYLAKVYVIPPLGASLLANERTKQLANSFDFTTGPQVLSNNRHRYYDGTGGSMTIDLDSGNFFFNRRVSTESGILDPSLGLPSVTQIGNDFKKMLNNHGLLRNGLGNGSTVVEYNGPRQTDSQQATVWIGPDPIDDFEIITPTFRKGLVQGTIVKSNHAGKKYIDLKYKYWEIDLLTSSTYPIRPINQAFEDLQNNLGIIFTTPTGNRISVSKASLAYFLADTYTQYLQPVYIFEGQGFAAMVPAITDEYTE